VKIETLYPYPKNKTQFAWSHHVTVPPEPGCYALATYSGNVLYVGLATASIRDRMAVHLDADEKRKVGELGAAFWFYYLSSPASEVGRIERGWMNQSVLEDGDTPSPTKRLSMLRK
jgi:hypothetical protein